MTFRRSVVLFLFLVTAVLVHADRLTEFSDAFWRWRAQEQPFTPDDIPRIERPANLNINWSRRAQGAVFSLLKFHDFVWNNGYVPIALQRWELLNDAKDVPTPMPASLP